MRRTRKRGRKARARGDVDIPLRLANARALPICTQQEPTKSQPVKSRVKIDRAASPIPESRQPKHLTPRAKSNRNGGRDHLGILGEIKTVHQGEIIGISNVAKRLCAIEARSPTLRNECALQWRNVRRPSDDALSRSTTCFHRRLCHLSRMPSQRVFRDPRAAAEDLSLLDASIWRPLVMSPATAVLDAFDHFWRIGR